MDIFAGELAAEILKELKRVVRQAVTCKHIASQLIHTIESLLPIVNEILLSSPTLPPSRQNQLTDLADHLRLGLVLARTAASSSRWNVYRNIQLTRRMEKIDRWIDRWIRRQMPLHLLAGLHHLQVDSTPLLDRVEAAPTKKRRVSDMMDELGVGIGVLDRPVGARVRVAKERVKDMLMAGRELVGICGIGGSGKTTLAREICRDQQIRDFFGDRIFFETVSQSPDLESLKMKMWEQFQPRTKGPTLIVLDDVWSLAELEDLVFRVPGCRTLVMSRFKFPTVIHHIYELELLGEEEALSLFCSSAFEQQSIPLTADRKLVKQVAEECKGLPLALKVIGASLRGQTPKIWASTKSRLSRGEAISNSHEINLLERMATSIKFLSGKVKECFLDLGSFPEDKKIPLDLLINMWMEIHDLEEEDAFAILIELSNKNLLTMVKDAQNRAGDIYSSYCELSVTQHDVLRDLALHMGNREPLNSRRRLIMPRREDGLPKEWNRHKDHPFEAQIVSIHTGDMKESNWFRMHLPNAEVLILNFSSGTYFLPPFMANMPNLKFLVLINYGTTSTVLHNLSVFTSLNELRSLWFKKITIPPLPTTTVPLLNLQKISLVLCDLNHRLKGPTINLPLIFPRLAHLTIDHCVDLPELPSSICKMNSLESISISNCHDLKELPCELGKLCSLQILRIYACPGLKGIPRSVGLLKRLKYLDISQCINLRDLPNELSHLKRLEKIDMRECLQLRSIPRSLMDLESLGHVICDEEMALQWKEAERYIPELRIQVAEEVFDLDWLVE